MSFQIGDRVKLVNVDSRYNASRIGDEGTVVGGVYNELLAISSSGRYLHWDVHHVKIIDKNNNVKGENNMSVKYYRNLKDNFLWQEGAILSDEKAQGSDGGYSPVTDLFDKTEANDGEYISRRIVEHDDNKDMFERVYPIGDLKKMLFGNKKAAQAAMSAGAFKAKPAKK